ncbi:hypothetical protein [Chitinophaga polysaccharea]|uniref:hypothetical protein n=1 Tax=Chitinophaga polysaccharea TaxID=1293035 RepID=UPI0011589C71|nr:hypothetical protein [Chitinophaga polysaccharea]
MTKLSKVINLVERSELQQLQLKKKKMTSYRISSDSLSDPGASNWSAKICPRKKLLKMHFLTNYFNFDITPAGKQECSL